MPQVAGCLWSLVGATGELFPQSSEPNCHCSINSYTALGSVCPCPRDIGNLYDCRACIESFWAYLSFTSAVCDSSPDHSLKAPHLSCNIKSYPLSYGEVLSEVFSINWRILIDTHSHTHTHAHTYHSSVALQSISISDAWTTHHIGSLLQTHHWLLLLKEMSVLTYTHEHPIDLHK